MILTRLDHGTIEVVLAPPEAQALALVCARAELDAGDGSLELLVQSMGAAFDAASQAAALQANTRPETWRAALASLAIGSQT